MNAPSPRSLVAAASASADRALAYSAPGFLAIDTTTVEGRQVMLDALNDFAVLQHMRTPRARVQSAIELYRKTQRSARLNCLYGGYFASVAEARAFVRERIAECRRAWDQRPVARVARAVAA